MKECNKCNEVKTLTEYTKDKSSKDGFTYKCKLCCKEDKKIWNQLNKKQVKEYNKQYIQLNKEKRRKYQKHKLDTDPKYKLILNLRIRIYKLLNNNRSKHTLDILGCTIEEFKQHLEKQFESWMNWNNMAKRIIPGQNMVWEPDHIVPLSSAKTEEEIYKLNHYTNFQPLCAYNNRFIKRDKI